MYLCKAWDEGLGSFCQANPFSQNRIPFAQFVVLFQVIPSVKRKALRGSSIVFSGVVPTHVRLERSKPFLVARSLGAKVTEKVGDDTTHLVAARLGTAKVNQIRSSKKLESRIHLVSWAEYEGVCTRKVGSDQTQST